MPALQGFLENAVSAGIEVHAKADYVPHGGGALPDELLHGGVVVLLASGNYCVVKVQLIAVVLVLQHGGNPALSQSRAGNIRLALGQQQDAYVLWELQRGVKPRNPTAGY